MTSLVIAFALYLGIQFMAMEGKAVGEKAEKGREIRGVRRGEDGVRKGWGGRAV